MLIYAAVLYYVYHRKITNLSQILTTSKDSYSAQIAAINKSLEEEKSKRQKIEEEYLKVIDQLTKKYSEDKLELIKEEHEKIKEYVSDYYENPERLKQILKERYGLKYVSAVAGEPTS
jgi:phosphoenolpyruvate carboxylase